VKEKSVSAGMGPLLAFSHVFAAIAIALFTTCRASLILRSRRGCLLAGYVNVRLSYGSTAKRSGQRGPATGDIGATLRCPALMCTAVVRLAFRDKLGALQAGEGANETVGAA
jgi:hypothetical protein